MYKHSKYFFLRHVPEIIALQANLFGMFIQNQGNAGGNAEVKFQRATGDQVSGQCIDTLLKKYAMQ